jgi:hypothetical protein
MEVGLFFKVINAGYFHCANNGLNLSTSEITSVRTALRSTKSEERLPLEVCAAPMPARRRVSHAAAAADRN